MKEIYRAPEAQVISFVSKEEMAAPSWMQFGAGAASGLIIDNAEGEE